MHAGDSLVRFQRLAIVVMSSRVHDSGRTLCRNDAPEQHTEKEDPPSVPKADDPCDLAEH